MRASAKAGLSVMTILRPGRENSFKFSEKLRNVHSDSIPQYIVIDKIIAVNESIPHADDLGPRDLRVLHLQFFRVLARSFTDKFYERVTARQSAPTSLIAQLFCPFSRNKPHIRTGKPSTSDEYRRTFLTLRDS